MATPRFEVLSGTIDGVNTTFTVSTAYQPGSLAVFINGLLMRRDLEDGWTETDPATGTLDLKEAPEVGPSGGGDPDVLQAFFLDTAPSIIEVREVCPLIGRIEDPFKLEGILSCPVLVGEISAVDELEGVLGTESVLVGEIEDVIEIVGHLECA